MARIILTESFVEGVSQVHAKSKRREIMHAVELLESFPQLGSSNLPSSIVQRFGGGVRKLAIAPFDVIYQVDSDADTVLVLGLVHQRAAF